MKFVPLLLLLGFAMATIACNPRLKVVGEDIAALPDGTELTCTIRNRTDETITIGVLGALIRKRSTERVKHASGVIGPGERQSFSLVFAPVEFDDYRCKVQEIYNPRVLE